MSSNAPLILAATGLLFSLVGVLVCMYANRQAGKLESKMKAEQSVFARFAGKK